MLIVFTILAAVSAALHIGAEYGGRRLQVYLFKPLTMLFIIAIALQAPSSLYKHLILAALLFSLGGDIFLMLPGDRFIAGLFSFLIAHLFYIAAFTIESAQGPASIVMAIALLIYGGLMMRLLLPSLGRMKGPVILYMLVILLMVWQAGNRYLNTEARASLLSFAGAALFAASDSLLALNRFRRRFRSAQFLILATYFAAQWLIALSVALRA
jgi:uncharacterized membrane protein YhhN